MERSVNAEQAKAVVRPQSAAGPATRASRVRARLEALDERCRPMLRVRRASHLRSPGREARAPLLLQSQTRDGALQERTRHLEEGARRRSTATARRAALGRRRVTLAV